MEQNGGSFDGCQSADGALTVRVDTCGGTLDPTTVESCTVCHKAGAFAAVAVVHVVDLGHLCGMVAAVSLRFIEAMILGRRWR